MRETNKSEKMKDRLLGCLGRQAASVSRIEDEFASWQLACPRQAGSLTSDSALTLFHLTKLQVHREH